MESFPSQTLRNQTPLSSVTLKRITPLRCHSFPPTDFDLAEQLFDDIAKDYPHRMEDIDTYSNILYVMGRRAKLSQLAHRYVTVDRNRPETCCLVGTSYW